jgi:hypothetical protein
MRSLSDCRAEAKLDERDHLPAAKIGALASAVTRLGKYRTPFSSGLPRMETPGGFEDVRFGSKADIRPVAGHVRLVPTADTGQT